MAVRSRKDRIPNEYTWFAMRQLLSHTLNSARATKGEAVDDVHNIGKVWFTGHSD